MNATTIPAPGSPEFAAAAKRAIAGLIAPFVARAVAGEITTQQALGAIAGEYQRQSGCSDAEAVRFTQNVIRLIA